MNPQQKARVQRWLERAEPAASTQASWEAFLAEEAEIAAGERVQKALLGKDCAICDGKYPECGCDHVCWFCGGALAVCGHAAP